VNDFQVGDLVVCMCLTKTWYRGLPGVIIDFEGPGKTDPVVSYGHRTMRLAKSSLRLLNESR